MIRAITSMDFEQVRSIFYETSAVQVFSSEEVKKKFEWKYLGWYLENHRNLFFVAEEISPVAGASKNQILGYIACCPDTKNATDLLGLNPSLEIFRDFYDQYPAHLHINLSADARGKGLGSELIQHLEGELRRKNTRGLHLLTSPNARNRGFYSKNGFSKEVERQYKEAALLFMGKKLGN